MTINVTNQSIREFICKSFQYSTRRIGIVFVTQLSNWIVIIMNI